MQYIKRQRTKQMKNLISDEHKLVIAQRDYKKIIKLRKKDKSLLGIDELWVKPKLKGTGYICGISHK